MRLLIARDGTIISVEVANSSGYPELDRGAKEAFRKLGRIKPIPADIQPGTPQFIVEIPINMKLE